MSMLPYPVKGPPTHAGNYLYEDNRIYYRTYGKKLIVCHGQVWPIFRVIDSAGNISNVFVFEPANGTPRIVRITAEMSESDSSKIAFTVGVIIFEQRHFAYCMKEALTLSYIQAQAPLTLVDSKGWFGNGYEAFYTGKKVICTRDFSKKNYYFEKHPDTPFQKRGTLPEWQKYVGVHCQASPIVLGVTCLSIASILLPLLNMSSRLVNVYGQKGTGKTIFLQIAATIWGNGIDPAHGATAEVPPFIAKADSTKCALDIMLSIQSPYPALLDEMTEADIGTLYQMLYQVASGMGKNRAKPNITAQVQKTWRLSVVTTSEKSIAEILAKGNKTMLGGQADRAIDVPINASGIFTDFSGFKDLYDLQDHLKRATGLYYGTPGEAIIKFIVEHPDKARQVFDLLNEFENLLLPEGCAPGQRRVIKHFAGGLVAGYLAILAGVLTCTTEDLDQAFKAITTAWWNAQKPPCFDSIADFIEDNADDISWEAPDLKSHCVAFIFHGLLVIRADEFERYFAAKYKEMLDQLYSNQALKRKQLNRNKSRYCNNAMETYDIDLARIAPFLSAELREALEL